MSLSMGQSIRLQFFFSQTDLLASTSQELIAPMDGFIDALDTIVQAAVTTGGTVVVKNNAGNNVAGISNTVANSAAKGARASSTATPGSSTRAVSKGDRIQVTPASFASAGALSGFVTIATGK